MLLVTGADSSWRMLELVARATVYGHVIVFHAMPLRPAIVKRFLS